MKIAKLEMKGANESQPVYRISLNASLLFFPFFFFTVLN